MLLKIYKELDTYRSEDEGVLDKLSKMNPFLMNGGLFEYSKETKVTLYLLVIGVLLFAAGVFSLR
jgi:hypothetical protein